MDSRICQTFTASPAEPRGLPAALARRFFLCFDYIYDIARTFRQLVIPHLDKPISQKYYRS